MLAHTICKFERIYAKFNFNKRPQTVKALISFLSELGVETIEDTGINNALSIFAANKRCITFYNPNMNYDHQVLVLGHELGHWLLGHVQAADLLFNPQHFFVTSGFEKDAGIIGFLCWYPTPYIDKFIEQTGYLSYEELAYLHSNCDTEWPFMLEAFKARCKIYRAWMRIKASLKYKRED